MVQVDDDVNLQVFQNFQATYEIIISSDTFDLTIW